jgi:hypothetical protein
MAMALPAAANEKEGMPDLAQIDQTCLPTSTANLMIWFGKHGYPKLILSGENKDEQYLHTVHVVMRATDANFDLGTKMENITSGIQKFVKEQGYDCDAEFRGIEGKGPPFSRDWLKENDEPNKGFILIVGYCHYAPGSDTYSPAIGATHAVTLVDLEPDMMLIHDPAHYEDETGRKIIMTQMLTSGTFREQDFSMPVAGLMLLSGSLLEGPEDSQVILLGAVEITMHPVGDPKGPTTSAPNGVVAAGDGSTPSNKITPTTSSKSAPAPSWVAWFFNLFFGK